MGKTAPGSERRCVWWLRVCSHLALPVGSAHTCRPRDHLQASGPVSFTHPQGCLVGALTSTRGHVACRARGKSRF